MGTSTSVAIVLVSSIAAEPWLVSAISGSAQRPNRSAVRRFAGFPFSPKHSRRSRPIQGSAGFTSSGQSDEISRDIDADTSKIQVPRDWT
jgi:hypothetical protein